MNLSFSNSAIKYIMFTMNFIFVITGIIIIAVGASISSKYSTYDEVLDGKYFSLPSLLIATGVIIFLISFLGCYGAFRENWLFLMIFSVLLGVIFIFEFSAGIAGYVLKGQTSDYLESEFTKSMKIYINSKPMQIMWDSIQREFECCGVHGKENWEDTFKNKSLPLSCCPGADGIVGVFYCNAEDKPTPAADELAAQKKQAENVGNLGDDTSTTDSVTTTTSITTVSEPSTTVSVATTTSSTTAGSTPMPASSTKPYAVGCESAFGDWVKSHAVDIGICGFTLAIIQLFGVGFSFHLARLLRNGIYNST